MIKLELPKITNRQKELLEIIYRSIKNNGYPPSFEELKSELGVSSKQTIADHLKSLENKGLIAREEKAARGIKIKLAGYQILNYPPLTPFFGISYAGSLTETSPINNNWQTISSDIKFNDEVFLVEISGDSMVESGIYEGDHLVAEPSAEFSSRDIVVARVGDQTTVKRFMTQNHPPYIFLKPENPKYDIILFSEETKMEAKIIGKYQANKITALNPKTKSFNN